MGIAALSEGVIDEHKQILSTGSISVPNPYDPAHPSIFKDWRVNGWVDVRQAIAVSSDVYFYEVGGGYQDQKGIGIDNIDNYLRLFGFGAPTGLAGFDEPSGTIPTPAWKLATFNGDPWRLGDTYHTAIGQYGVQVTPLQAARAVAALANDGTLLTPTLLASSTPQATHIDLPQHYFEVVKEGMRLGVTQGIAGAVNVPFVEVAAKTGTAQVGVHNEYLNSWMVGFFPYEHPRYAYAVVLEKGPAGTLVGASAAMSDFLSWMQAHAPQYLQ
jgi:penicillin-binding protein 2